jgi:hypothetical protein
LNFIECSWAKGQNCGVSGSRVVQRAVVERMAGARGVASSRSIWVAQRAMVISERPHRPAGIGHPSAELPAF